MTLRQQMPRRHVLIAGASSGTGKAPTRLPRPPLDCSDVYLSIARAPVSLLLERPSRARLVRAAAGPGTDLGAYRDGPGSEQRAQPLPRKLRRLSLESSDVYLSIARAPVPGAARACGCRPGDGRRSMKGMRLPTRGRAVEHEGSAAAVPGTGLGAYWDGSPISYQSRSTNGK
jgi:hypothetical protein